MNELIKIEERDGEQLVNGRELHAFLEVKTPYKKWFDRMTEYGFVENVDFSVLDKKVQDDTAFGGYRIVTDHAIKISMAKELAMIQRTEKGKQAREYFIKCEEAWNSPEMILVRANQIQSRMIESYKTKVAFLENKIEKDKPLVDFAVRVSDSSDLLLVREFCKLLYEENEINIGEKRMYNWLRKNGYILQNSTEPTQKAIEQGLFKVIEKALNTPYGTKLVRTTKITGRGQIYFTEKLRKLKEIEEINLDKIINL